MVFFKFKILPNSTESKGKIYRVHQFKPVSRMDTRDEKAIKNEIHSYLLSLSPGKQFDSLNQLQSRFKIKPAALIHDNSYQFVVIGNSRVFPVVSSPGLEGKAIRFEYYCEMLALLLSYGASSVKIPTFAKQIHERQTSLSKEDIDEILKYISQNDRFYVQADKFYLSTNGKKGKKGEESIQKSPPLTSFASSRKETNISSDKNTLFRKKSNFDEETEDTNGLWNKQAAPLPDPSEISTQEELKNRIFEYFLKFPKPEGVLLTPNFLAELEIPSSLKLSKLIKVLETDNHRRFVVDFTTLYCFPHYFNQSDESYGAEVIYWYLKKNKSISEEALRSRLSKLFVGLPRKRTQAIFTAITSDPRFIYEFLPKTPNQSILSLQNSSTIILNIPTESKRLDPNSKDNLMVKPTRKQSMQKEPELGIPNNLKSDSPNLNGLFGKLTLPRNSLSKPLPNNRRELNHKVEASIEIKQPILEKGVTDPALDLVVLKGSSNSKFPAFGKLIYENSLANEYMNFDNEKPCQSIALNLELPAFKILFCGKVDAEEVDPLCKVLHSIVRDDSNNQPFLVLDMNPLNFLAHMQTVALSSRVEVLVHPLVFAKNLDVFQPFNCDVKPLLLPWQQLISSKDRLIKFLALDVLQSDSTYEVISLLLSYERRSYIPSYEEFITDLKVIQGTRRIHYILDTFVAESVSNQSLRDSLPVDFNIFSSSKQFHLMDLSITHDISTPLGGQSLLLPVDLYGIHSYLIDFFWSSKQVVRKGFILRNYDFVHPVSTLNQSLLYDILKEEENVAFIQLEKPNLSSPLFDLFDLVFIPNLRQRKDREKLYNSLKVDSTSKIKLERSFSSLLKAEALMYLPFNCLLPGSLNQQDLKDFFLISWDY